MEKQIPSWQKKQRYNTRNRAWFFMARRTRPEACHSCVCWVPLLWQQHLPTKNSTTIVLWWWLFSQSLHLMASVATEYATAAAFVTIPLSPIPTFLFYITAWSLVIYERPSFLYRQPPEDSLALSTQSSSDLHSKMEAIPHSYASFVTG